MSEDGGTPAAGDTGGSNGTDTQGGAPAGTQNSGGTPGTGTTANGGVEWDAIASEFGDPEKVRKALEHARTWEQRAKENRAGAQQAKTLEQQLTEMQQQMSDRDKRDLERSGKTAIAQLKAELGQAGVKWDDVDEPLRPDASRLLKNGEPDDDAIARYAAALTRHAGRPVPDPDQGKKGASAPADMNSWIRQRAGVK